MTWAEEHLFARHSVVREHELWRHALEHARGQDITLADLQTATGQRDYVRNRENPGKIASREALEREWALVRIAREGAYDFHPLSADYRPAASSLDSEQRDAVQRILSSRHFVTLFRGGAGTGKSHTPPGSG